MTTGSHNIEKECPRGQEQRLLGHFFEISPGAGVGVQVLYMIKKVRYLDKCVESDIITVIIIK